MTEKRSLARLYGPPLLVITFVLPFLAYYVSLTRRQAAYLDYRAFNTLEAASTHLQKEVAGVRSAMQGADRVGHQVLRRGARQECGADLACREDWAPPGNGERGVAAEVLAYLREYVKLASDVWYAPEESIEENHASQFRLTLCCRDQTRPWQLRAALTHDGHERMWVTIPPASLEPRLLPGESADVFDSMLAARTDGSVIFRSSKSPYQAEQVDALFANVVEAAKQAGEAETIKASSAGLATRAGASSRTEVSAFGDKFLVYVQPTPFRLAVEGEKADAEKSVVLVGIVRRSRYDAEANAVPPGLLAAVVLGLVILAAVSWPLLKLFTMSPKERLRRLSLIGLFLSTMTAFLLISLLYLEFGFVLWLYDRTDTRIERIATRMGQNLRQEVTDVLASLKGHEQWLHEQGIEPNLETLHFLGETPPHLRKEYPYFRHAVFALYRPDAVGATGFVQHYKLSAERIPTPLLSTPFAQFPALGDLARGRALRLPDGRPFALQTIASPNTGEFLTLFFTHPERQVGKAPPAGARQVMMLTTPLVSLKEAVLPLGFGYAVVNSKGLVQFHSDSSLNLRENFFTECDNPERVASLIQLKGATHLDLRYRGRDRRAYLTTLSQAVPGLDWTVIVYRDSSYLESIAMDAGLLFVLGLVTVAAVAAVGWVLKQLYRMIRPQSVFRYSYRRIWPIERRKPRYLRQAVCLAVGLVVVLASTLPQGPDASAGLLGGLVCAVGALALGAWRPVRLWLDRQLRPLNRRLPLPLVFTMFWAALLLLVALSGSLLLFQASLTAVQHQHEVAAHGTLLERLRQRAALAEADERQRGEKDTWYAQRRIATALDIYDPRAYAGSWKQFVEARLSSPLDEPLRALNRHLLPPVGERAFASLMRAAGETGSIGPDWASAQAVFPGGRGVPLAAWPVVPWKETGSETFWGKSYVLLGLVIAFAMFIWLYSVLRRLFAQEFDDPDPLRARPWETLGELPARLMLLCHPRSGSSQLARERFPGQVIDIAQEFSGDAEAVAKRRERLLARYTNSPQVVVDNLEWQFSNPVVRRETLRLLEGLVFGHRSKVLVLSALDPVSYLEAAFTEQPAAALREELDRWIRAMGGFERALFDMQDSLQPEWQILRRRLEEWEMPKEAINECRRIFWREFSGTVHLQQQAMHFVERLMRPGTRCRSAHDFERLMIAHARELADDYYRQLWISMSAGERLALYQLAKDRWVNPLNKTAVCQLIRKRIIRNGRGTRAYEMLNESFRQFVLESQDPEEVRRWREDEQSSTWRSVRLSLVTVLVLTAMWLLYVRQDLFDRVFSYAGAVAGGSAALLRVSWQAIQQLIAKPKAEGKP